MDYHLDNASNGYNLFLAAQKQVAIIGVPFSGGQPRKGVDLGPTHLREAGLASAVEALGWKIAHDEDVTVDAPDRLEVVGSLKNPRMVGDVCRRLHETVFDHAKKGEFCLTLGGDHSIAVGSISGILKARPETGIIWVDAHADINTPQTSPSGNLHGMPVSLLMGIAGNVAGFEWLTPELRPDRIAYIGLRDLDEGEKHLLKKHNIMAFSMTEVDELGISKVVQLALDRVSPRRQNPVHLSFDIDGLDMAYAPATGTAVLGGLTVREGRYLCEVLAREHIITSMDMVEVNPALSDGKGTDLTCAAAMLLMQAALGRTLV